jgi:hypothetical protein
VNYGDPKFERGDLVVFKQDTVGELVETLGIIVSHPTLMFSHKWPNEEREENFWSYDVKVGNSLFKMVPEAFIRRLKDEDETEDT